MRYFIQHDHFEEGPLDIVAMIRKIRKGTLAPDAIVRGEGEEPGTAISHPKLTVYYKEMITRTDQGLASANKREFRFRAVVKSGIRFLNRNQSSTIFTAMLLLLSMVTGLALYSVLPKILLPVAILVGWVMFLFGQSLLQLILLRQHRGQPIDGRWFFGNLGKLFVPILAFSGFLGIISLIGMGLVLIPGLFALALYCFTPMIMLETGTNFWDAMQQSRRMALSQGYDLFGILFGLIVLNFIATLFFLLPLLIVLPITYGAIAELYEELSA